MRQLRHLLRLAGDGTSARNIALTLGIARSTVQDNLKRAAAAGLTWPLPGDLTDDALENRLFARAGVKQGLRRRPEPNWAQLALELKKPGVTLMILWEEYRAIHPDGYGYSRFCDLFRSFERRLSPTMRQEHVAGDKVFVDYSGKKIAVVDRSTGEIREAEIFVAVLGASGLTYAEATWTQTLPDWIGAHVRMFRFFGGVPRLIVPDNLKSGVNRVVEIVGLLGHSAGGRPGERLMQRLGMPVSDDTILRQLKRDAAGAQRNSEIRVVGIDDWSWRRATSYGTIMVDLERRSVIDILDDRSVDSAAKWLRSHPSIETVSRDRCGLYAQAVREGAPQAQQVADRFHLIQNLRSAIEEQMSLSGRATGRAILSEDAIVDAATHRRRARLAHRQSRQEIFEMLHALRHEGLSYSEIARRTGYERRSVANWLKFKAPPDRRRAALNPTSPWYFEAFLAQCWKDGNRCGRHLFHDVKQRGYTGSFSNLERLLGAWRRAERERGDDVSSMALNSEPVRDPDTGHAISPIVAAALCIKPRGLLTPRQARKVDALKQGSEAFAEMRRLAMRFNGILRGKRSAPLDAWIDDAIESDLIPIMRFARVLRRDIDAVNNAIELPWSNGQAEGQINRLKTLKRAMYGRAGPELLRARMLPPLHTK